MRKMIEMDCCDCCGKPFYCDPLDVPVHDVINRDGEVDELAICEDCLDKSIYTTCDFCGNWIKVDDCLRVNDDMYCPECAERAIEELEDNVNEAKRQLANVKAAFEKRKNKRE